MVSLSDNAIVSNPRKELTRTQQDALTAISFYRRQKKTGKLWLIGDKRISQKLVWDLQRLDLLSEDQIRGQSVLRLTTAGGLVADRLSH
jgi:hypothetical protein